MAKYFSLSPQAEKISYIDETEGKVMSQMTEERNGSLDLEIAYYTGKRFYQFYLEYDRAERAILENELADPDARQASLKALKSYYQGCWGELDSLLTRVRRLRDHKDFAKLPELSRKVLQDPGRAVLSTVGQAVEQSERRLYGSDI